MHYLSKTLWIVALLLVSFGAFAQSAHAQGGHVRVSIACTTMGSTGQARVDEPHDVSLTVNGPNGPVTVNVHVPKKMTAQAVAELLIEALEDRGIPGATQTTFADPDDTEVDKAAKRDITLPAGYTYSADLVTKTKGNRPTEAHLKVGGEKQKSGSGVLPLAIEWIRVRGFDDPNRSFEIDFELQSTSGVTVFHFDQFFHGEVGTGPGFLALQQSLIEAGYPAFHTQTYELFVYVGAAPTPIGLVRSSVTMADDVPSPDGTNYEGEFRAVWHDLEIQ